MIFDCNTDHAFGNSAVVPQARLLGMQQNLIRFMRKKGKVQVHIGAWGMHNSPEGECMALTSLWIQKMVSGVLDNLQVLDPTVLDTAGMKRVSDCKPKRGTGQKTIPTWIPHQMVTRRGSTVTKEEKDDMEKARRTLTEDM
ncbi:hypothetical protein BP6252_00533 [Coleophoma cylindrospora]|uniref:Uncharacterized protein n=1 Tax=Coleophoma cylindrospora TaxID=1849047 RepID=A0A3D8SQP1_9HELO|nr:hypothetical protein BP6252_00533 [Coleophoma cylindrospora]